MDKDQKDAIDNGIEHFIDSMETALIPAMCRVAIVRHGTDENDALNEKIADELRDFAEAIIRKKLTEAEAEIRLALMKM